MRARIVKADEARTDAAHEARAAQVAEAATEATTANREAAEAWDALATHAAKQAGECRHGAELADRTRRFVCQLAPLPCWHRSGSCAPSSLRLRVLAHSPCVSRRAGVPRQ